MGSGKTLTTTFLGTALSNVTKSDLYANYDIKSDRFKFIKTRGMLMAINNGIIILDEAHLFLDSRNWKDKSNIDLTHWATKIRKKNLLCFVISQHIRQVDVRIRNLMDVLVVCERIGYAMRMTFVDYQYNLVGRRIILERPEEFYSLYDTFEIVKAL